MTTDTAGPSTPRASAPIRHDVTLWTPMDFHLFHEGTHFQIFQRLGAHPMTADGVDGINFSVWAPTAHAVAVMGDFNAWNPTSHPLVKREGAGIWEGFVPGLKPGTVYKYAIRSPGGRGDKADPVAFATQIPPETASVVTALDHAWKDDAWLKARGKVRPLNAPMSIYEVHLGSWMRVPEEGNRFLTYTELAQQLSTYVKAMGFTHVEFMPVTEHPFYGSWGYQTTGYFAPSSRFGSPQEFMALVDALHQQGVGVILDWVPSHFPTDGHGLGYFDGTHLFEHADQRQGFHPDWKSFIFNYGRHEVRSFLISSAVFWLEKYHIDGIRVDAVASMLYLDYSRKAGEWIANKYGGKENLEAIDFLKRFNEEVHRRFPDVITIAEESTAWPLVSRPTYAGGLGFDFKWDMGWMHDTLKYFSEDPIHRKYHHNKLTFRGLYAFNENFVLPISHDEVVHGKGSLINKMTGDPWRRRANERLLLGYMYAQPGKKLLFMGSEFAQSKEWNHDSSLDWHLLDNPEHRGIQEWTRALNRAYAQRPALHELDCDPKGFEWIDCNDAENSVVSLLRKSADGKDVVMVVCNFTPVVRRNYRIGAPQAGTWLEMLNSDAHEYGGSGLGNMGRVEAAPVPMHGRPASVSLTLPPLGILFLRPERVEAGMQEQVMTGAPSNDDVPVLKKAV